MQALPLSPSKLPERTVLAVAGADAQSFLQGLVTADIDALAKGEAAYAAFLQPQGKILFDFFVFNDGERYLIDCSAAQKADLLKRLAFYKLRAKATIAELDGYAVGVAFARPQGMLAFADPRSPLLGFRVIAPEAELPMGEPSRYRLGRIRLGIADTDEDIGSGKLFPHEANFDQLGGVSFTKGCYVGQEVVSRMEHRGTARSRILPVRVEGGAPEAGTEIKAGEIAVGSILSSDGEDALALIRLDRLKDAAAAGRTLLTDGRTVHVRKPQWADFDVALAAAE
jgi:folate-binding protein YgfZ